MDRQSYLSEESKGGFKMIWHLAYRVDKGAKQHIYALKKICEQKKNKLSEQYGDRIKFYRLERA